MASVTRNAGNLDHPLLKKREEGLGRVGMIVQVTLDRDLQTPPPADQAYCKAVAIDKRTLEITYDRDQSSAGQVLALVQQHGYAIEDVTTREADLEDVFVQLTGAS